MAGMHINLCKSLQECGEINLEHVLTAHSIVSSVGGQASTWIKPTDPTNIEAVWGVAF